MTTTYGFVLSLQGPKLELENQRLIFFLQQFIEFKTFFNVALT